MQGRKANIDLTGQVFFELFVEGPSNVRIRNRPTWKCKCSCGKYCYYTTNELRSGNRKSCGHLVGRVSALDLTGMKFNELTVLYRVKNSGNSKSSSGNIVGKTFWRCRCSCGVECNCQTSDLTSGKRKDCGHSHNEYMHQTKTKDITGETYGYLKVVEMLPSVKRKKKWRSMCRAICLL